MSDTSGIRDAGELVTVPSRDVRVVAEWAVRDWSARVQYLRNNISQGAECTAHARSGYKPVPVYGRDKRGDDREREGERDHCCVRYAQAGGEGARGGMRGQRSEDSLPLSPIDVGRCLEVCEKSGGNSKRRGGVAVSYMSTLSGHRCGDGVRQQAVQPHVKHGPTVSR
jgi:hypothetical protein